MIEIVETTRADDAAWRDYTGRNPEARLFHDRRWGDVIEKAYGHRTVHLAAKRGGRVVGVLPVTDVKSALLGRALISGAFAVAGGALADDDEALGALCGRAHDMGRELGVKYVELRGGGAPANTVWVAKSGIHAAFVRELPATEDGLIPWLPKNRRAQVKKAMRIESEHGASLRSGGTPEEFQPLYAESLRNLGTPVPPMALFREIMTAFADSAEITLCMKDGAPIAGVLSFWHGGSVAPYYIGGTAEARALFAYDYLYFSLMKEAIARGVRIFDYGRSKIGSTHFDTKTYWGFAPTPVVYQVGLVRAKELPNLSGANPKFALFSDVWKRLPLPVANLAGPILARHLA
ncbi:MAG: FemAB family XrtA/PEP-CTERM system-associated protein [Parvularculaceae bacterium]